ncbi:MAG: hybrid sensor histidine kinase/response regulator [Candidatus Kapaibacterium sp.]|jgi:DNA-binding response OmpR family regulator/anti-sigma regulatory factor (Ser/Thr protein kinase)|nr:hybrid sensor histidine kinase/response regulator [Candidatus Kapabacteria bacterium]
MKELILIIEDEIEISNDLEKFLRLSGYDTVTARSGEDALKLLEKNIPDLIISDILVPGIDGYELLKRMQASPETAAVPFLFLSAKSNKIDVREAMNLGADDFITKPYDIDELLNTIKVRLEKKQRRESHLTKKIENLQINLRKTMPHEIRTPLNVILGFSEFLLKNNKKIQDSDALDMVYNIHLSGQRLQRTFENYLLYANLELVAATQSEKTKYNKYKTFMADVFIRDVAVSKASEFERADDLQLDLIDATVKIYEDHFRKLVDEILDNSFKFSNPGDKVNIKSSMDGDRFIMIVRDVGRGMTEEQLSKSGDFVQFDRKIYEQQGTGLGLSIVKKITMIYNGEFEITSSPEHFTEVIIKLFGTEGLG